MEDHRIGAFARLLMPHPTGDLATAVGVHIATVVKWKSGQYLPKPEEIKKIAFALGKPYTAVERVWLDEKTARKEHRREAASSA